jgi:hypothetical protein
VDCRKDGALQAAEKRLITDNHPGAQGVTPPESGGELSKNSPPQMRRAGAERRGGAEQGIKGWSWQRDDGVE